MWGVDKLRKAQRAMERTILGISLRSNHQLRDQEKKEGGRRGGAIGKSQMATGWPCWEGVIGITMTTQLVTKLNFTFSETPYTKLSNQ